MANMSGYVMVNGVRLSLEAARNAEMVGADPAEDVRRLRSGAVTREALLAECLDGAEVSVRAAWQEYVSDVVVAAGV